MPTDTPDTKHGSLDPLTLEACQEKVGQASRDCLRKIRKAVKSKGNSQLLVGAGEIVGQILIWVDREEVEREAGKILVDLGVGDAFQDSLKHFRAGIDLGAKSPRDLPGEINCARAASGDLAALDAVLASNPTQDPAVLRRLILADPDGSRWYVWSETLQHYCGPFGGRVVRERFVKLCPNLSMTAEDLSRVLPRRLGTVLYSDTGSLRALDDVFQLCGTVPGYIEHVAGQIGGHWKADGSLSVGIAEFRSDLTPLEDPQITRWLELLAGEHLPALLDWLATFRQVTRPTCAIYLEGVGAAGKTMFAPALARLFKSRSFVRYEHVTSDFNDGLKDSVLVLADERMPDQTGRRGAPSAVFRELVASDQIEINGKNTRKERINAALRIVITANNSTAMNFNKEAFTSQDVAAIADRILRISPEDKMQSAADYLRDIGGRPTTQAWVRGDGFARHVLWLEGARTVTPGSRFLVHGGGLSSQLPAAAESGWIQDLVDVMRLKIDRDPLLLAIWASKGVEIRENWLYVRPPGLAEIWNDLMPGERHPGKQEFRRILNNAGAVEAYWGYSKPGDKSHKTQFRGLRIAI